jgi:hypothetical protein
MKRTGLIVALALCLLSGCGGSGEGSSGSAAADCLSPSQASEQINRIAEGFEESSTEVEAKQEEIRAVKAEAC